MRCHQFPGKLIAQVESVERTTSLASRLFFRQWTVGLGWLKKVVVLVVTQFSGYADAWRLGDRADCTLLIIRWFRSGRFGIKRDCRVAQSLRAVDVKMIISILSCDVRAHAILHAPRRHYRHNWDSCG